MAAEKPSSDTIFCIAVEMASADERAAYIAQACGEDEQLRAQVQMLVDAHFQAGSFLQSPADVGATVDSQPPAAGEDIAGHWHAETPRSRPVAERPGAVIGPYKLVQEIGEGGMGTVFLAQQTEPVKRLVALKVIKPGMDSRQVIARFEAERQALALMDHPNIAKVLDAGATDSGRPYFVMELVKGVPITKYCDEHQLTPRQRLELMVPVCQAVQHAHQKGIIHRDLKPSNVLVASYDGKPVPKVIDFGVAKAAGQQLTEHTLVTGFGVVVGTLEYMSPEQAEFNQLDIDTRSDVYSLGVLLYELLTGTTPLEKKRLKEAAMLEVLRIIREEEPPKPSTRLSTVEGLPSIAANRGLEPKRLSRTVRGELDWIVMKALEKDRNRRYETANGFALDIQRYLADEPVQACPPSMLYRLRKMSRRNRAALTAAALVVLALVLGIAVSTWQAVEATLAREADRKSRDALDAAREEKEQQRTRTNRELSDALVEAVRLQEKVRTARTGDAEPANQFRAMLARTGTLADNELVDPVLVGRVRAMQAEVNQSEKDRRMVARLEEIRFNQGVVKNGVFITRSGATAPEYQAAFRDYGIPITDVFSLTSLPSAERVEEVARRIAASAIRDALVAALDECASNNATWMERLLPVARRVEQNNAWRRQYFDARIRVDRAAMARLAKEPEALAQPSIILVHLATMIYGARDFVGAVELLREAQRRHPADMWINRELASTIRSTKPSATPDDSLGFYRAALAGRPESVALHHELAGWLRFYKRDDEAVAVYRQAIRLKPDNAHAYTEMGRTLVTKKGQADLAIAACRKRH